MDVIDYWLYVNKFYLFESLFLVPSFVAKAHTDTKYSRVALKLFTLSLHAIPRIKIIDIWRNKGGRTFILFLSDFLCLTIYLVRCGTRFKSSHIVSNWVNIVSMCILHSQLTPMHYHQKSQFCLLCDYVARL